MKVVILSGGFGTRISEYTTVIPKPMIRINGKPIIEHIILKSRVPIIQKAIVDKIIFILPLSTPPPGEGMENS